MAIRLAKKGFDLWPMAGLLVVVGFIVAAGVFAILMRSNIRHGQL